MPTIKEKLHFNYDGIMSSQFGVINIVLDGGLYEETYVASREIVETEIRGGNPILHDIQRKPLEFDLTIAFEDGFTDEKLEQVTDWLFKDYYRPLYFVGKENRVFMCMPIDDSSIMHNGVQQGYVNLKMRCNSPYLYSQEITTSNTTVGATPVEVTIESDTHIPVFLELSILKQGTGSVRIETLDSNGVVVDTFLITTLAHLENVYIDGKKELIKSDIVGMYRYDMLVGAFPKIKKGTNKFRITGNCGIQFRYKNKYKR